MALIRSETLKELVRRILRTRPDEVGCETCFEQLDRFVDLELEGKDASQALPLIKRHLDICSGCGEEYRALLSALENIEDSPA
ncbi:MAG: hypothetical protein WEC37_00415 [Anaerolineales bacterium]